MAGSRSAELKGADTVANDGFGISVVLSGTTLIIGAPDHAKLAGRAYVFTGTVGTWKQAGELKGADTVAKDGFGVSVALSARPLSCRRRIRQRRRAGLRVQRLTSQLRARLCCSPPSFCEPLVGKAPPA